MVHVTGWQRITGWYQVRKYQCWFQVDCYEASSRKVDNRILQPYDLLWRNWHHNQWLEAGIYDAVKNELASLPSIDSFSEIAHLVDYLRIRDEVVNVSEEIRESYVNDLN